jgi:hypothetical protein
MTTNTPLSIPLEAWPEIDRRLWETGRTSGYLASQKPTSIAEIVNGYGRWLSFLASRGDLDERTDAAGRVTSDRVRNYIDAMTTRTPRSKRVRSRSGRRCGFWRLIVVLPGSIHGICCAANIAGARDFYATLPNAGLMLIRDIAGWISPVCASNTTAPIDRIAAVGLLSKVSISIIMSVMLHTPH